jgi:hypothetical protein
MKWFCCRRALEVEGAIVICIAGQPQHTSIKDRLYGAVLPWVSVCGVARVTC